MRKVAAVVVTLGSLWLSGQVAAQSLTTGAVSGRVTDKESGEPLYGVSVTVGNQTVTTDEDGAYKVTDLIPGTYDIALEFDTAKTTRAGIVISANQLTTLNQAMKIGETVVVVGTPPPIRRDTKKVTTIDREQLESLPIPGSSFEAAMGQTPGTQNDGVGVAMSGSSGLENRYVLDGVDITGLTYGNVGTPVLNEFIHEMQVVSGGYNAEYGRSTGGIVNIITRSGTDEFRGSVFGTLTPGFLTASRKVAPSNSSSIDITGDNAYEGHFGFEMGGPIIKKKLWFYVGVSPEASRTDYTRVTKRQTDCRLRQDNGTLSQCSPANADASPDVDPTTGFYITDTVDSEVRSATAKSAQILAKINYAMSPEHQAQLSVLALPSWSESPALQGMPSTGTKASGLTTDTALRWSSKLNDRQTELEGILSWHRSTSNSGSIDPSYNSTPLEVLYGGDLGHLSSLGGESMATVDGCTDNQTGSDPYPLITNCPMNNNAYTRGGPGSLNHDKEERLGVRVGVLQRVKAAGHHEIKAGLDWEDNRKITARLYSGGAFIQNYGTQIILNRWAEIAPPGTTDPRYDQVCTTPDPNSGNGAMGGLRELQCRYVGGTVGEPGTLVGGETMNWGAYLQDSWEVNRGLVLNAGLRYEEQRLRYAEALRGTTDPLTGNSLGKTALALRNNWSPRLGVIWDPTEEGRSKIYGSWGRYFEAIPMDINDRSFGGELNLQQTYTAESCGPVDPNTGFSDGASCLTTANRPTSEQLIGSSGVLVAPGLKAQYMDETLLGGELALPSNYVFGLVAQHRRLGRVIEDVSTDGADTYIIANPGEFSEQAESDLAHRIATTQDKNLRDRLERDLERYRGIRRFDKPVRDYLALELSISRRFASGLFLSASYTYSRTDGNYPGLVSYDNGQIDPNISSQYDLIELLANRRGRLPQDRPHYVKVDAYRGFSVGGGTLTLGGRARALSGIPVNALGAHYLYGPDESFILPRGQLGRTEFEHGFDIHVSYKKKLNDDVSAELFFDVFNLYNRQGTFRVDETYAPQYSLAQNGGGGMEQNVNPISGGTYDDLVFAKSLDSSGNETSTPLGRNPNFGNTTAHYAPASAQVGFRVTF